MDNNSWQLFSFYQDYVGTETFRMNRFITYENLPKPTPLPQNTILGHFRGLKIIFSINL